MVTINSAVIHQLLKVQHEPAEIKLRDSLLDGSNTHVNQLITSVHELYSKNSAKGYGRFQNEESTYPIIGDFRALFEQKTVDFLSTSKQLMLHLEREASPVQMVTGAYVLMAHITTEQSIEHFIVAMISNAIGTAIDPDTFEVTKSVHVDVKDMRIAGRVNLTEWLTESSEKRYLNFLKPKGEVTEYFGRFLACDQMIQGEAETQKLSKAVKKFGLAHITNEDDRELFYRNVHEYCVGTISRSEEISLQELSNFAWPSNPDELSSHFAEFDGGVTGGFKLKKSGLCGLTKYTGSTKYWDLKMDSSAFNKGFADFNEEDGTLLLKNLPPQLLADIKERHGSTQSIENTEE